MSKGTRIKEYRERVHMSQVELAIKIGVSKQTLYKYENDIITNIPSDKIEAIARETCVTPEMIMGWRKPSVPFAFSSLEKEIIVRYRQADSGTQNSIRKLLDITEAEYLTPVAAHAQDGATEEELNEDMEMVKNSD